MEARDLLQIIRTHGASAHDSSVLDAADQLETALASQNRDLTTVHTLLSREQQEHILTRKLLAQTREEMAQAREEMAVLEEKLRIELARRYGKSSEKWKPTELETAHLFTEAEMLMVQPQSENPLEEDVPQSTSKPSQNQKKTASRGKRERLPDDLERETTILDIAEDQKICSECGREKQLIGKEVSEQLEMKPIEFYVKRIVRKTYACSCGNCGVEAAAAPAAVYPKSIMGDTVIAQVVASKYCDGLPFYRQERVLQRSGISISQQTMARAASRTADVFAPLVDLIGSELQRYPVVCADETRLRVLKDNGIKKDGTSYMWVAAGERAGHRLVRFLYEDGSRGANAARQLIGNFSGTLMCDGYGTYPAAVSDLPITLAACFAHVRRKFNDVLKGDRRNPQAQEAMKMIRELYAIEKDASGLDSEQILSIRQNRAKPVFDSFRLWLYEEGKRIPPKSALGRAVSYSVNLIDRLEIYLYNPSVPIDNNRAENAIRPFVVGRKAWLFNTESHGAKTSAALYTLIESAKANHLEPMHYLLFLFRCYQHFGEHAMPWQNLIPAPNLREYASEIGIKWGFD
ncbi:IS66 family transposase [Salinispira pacifica]|uniref:Mobile element protein n=1 Tax=Salinispira pacifica TaxID=1307761 RepID=V5WDY4_9SPIO|nr:IS66 family transposase [Salinispira pacifica]AHC13784.1 Mobile element protein [Salinispira pacifica]AHC15438.1 Mobile element protein [Salinispira pacifica]